MTRNNALRGLAWFATAAACFGSLLAAVPAHATPVHDAIEVAVNAVYRAGNATLTAIDADVCEDKAVFDRDTAGRKLSMLHRTAYDGIRRDLRAAYAATSSAGELEAVTLVFCVAVEQTLTRGRDPR